MLDGYNMDIHTQIKMLEAIIMSSEIISTALKRVKHKANL